MDSIEITYDSKAKLLVLTRWHDLQATSDPLSYVNYYEPITIERLSDVLDKSSRVLPAEPPKRIVYDVDQGSIMLTY